MFSDGGRGWERERELRDLASWIVARAMKLELRRTGWSWLEGGVRHR